MLIGQRTRLGLHGFGKAGNHFGVDRIGLGALTDGLGEVTNLCRIDDGQRQRGTRNRCRRNRLKAAGGFDRNQPRRKPLQPLDQLLQAFAVTRDRKSLPAWPYMHIQTVLRDIDANIDRVHLHPSLRNRARSAAQATVRVRWNGGRGAALRSGLQCPKVNRSPVRHRIGQPSRFGRA